MRRLRKIVTTVICALLFLQTITVTTSAAVSKEEFGAKEFICFAREENIASNLLVKSLGFTVVSSEMKTDTRDGHRYHLLQYSLKLS